MIQTKLIAEEITPLIQRQPEEEEEEPIEELEGEERPIMTKALSCGTLQVTDSLRTGLNRSKGGGQKLPETDRKMRVFAEKQKQTQQTKSVKSTKHGRSLFGQSRGVHSILHLQRTIGNQAVQRLLRTKLEYLEASSAGNASPMVFHDLSRIPVHNSPNSNIQPELKVNTPGDMYEQEADRVAEQVMHMPESFPKRGCCYDGCFPERQIEQVSQEHVHLQTHCAQAAEAGHTPVPPVVHEVLRSPGQSLSPATRAYFEPRFGHNFSRVRVHTDAKAAEAARAIDALAFTAGHHVAFGAGQYLPGTSGGTKLLAHELAHVLQQTGGRDRSGSGFVLQRYTVTNEQSRFTDPWWKDFPGGISLAASILSYDRATPEPGDPLNWDIGWVQTVLQNHYQMYYKQPTGQLGPFYYRDTTPTRDGHSSAVEPWYYRPGNQTGQDPARFMDSPGTPSQEIPWTDTMGRVRLYSARVSTDFVANLVAVHPSNPQLLVGIYHLDWGYDGYIEFGSDNQPRVPTVQHSRAHGPTATPGRATQLVLSGPVFNDINRGRRLVYGINPT